MLCLSSGLLSNVFQKFPGLFHQYTALIRQRWKKINWIKMFWWNYLRRKGKRLKRRPGSWASGSVHSATLFSSNCANLLLTRYCKIRWVRTKTIIYKLTHSYYTRIHLWPLVISEVFTNYTFFICIVIFWGVSLSMLTIFLIWVLYCAFRGYDRITTSERLKLSSQKCDNFYRSEMTSNSYR